MQHKTSVKAILCALLLSCGVAVADAFDGGVLWSILSSIPYVHPLAIDQPLSSNVSQRESNTPSCVNPTPEDAPACRTLEQQILSSTVRIEIEAWISHPAGPEGSGLYEVRSARGNGHGTVKDGRYLITHNHFDVPLPASSNASSIAFGTVTVYDANGERLALQAHPASLRIVQGGEETLELDFGLVGDVGFFAAAGLTSAHFESWQVAPLQVGTEVAQVNWDGSATRVDWVTIEAVVTDDGVCRLVLSRGLTPGASGGGVFWNSYHVANNWAVIETISADGGVRGRHSTAALNDAGEIWHNARRSKYPEEAG